MYLLQSWTIHILKQRGDHCSESVSAVTNQTFTTFTRQLIEQNKVLYRNPHPTPSNYPVGQWRYADTPPLSRLWRNGRNEQEAGATAEMGADCWAADCWAEQQLDSRTVACPFPAAVAGDRGRGRWKRWSCLECFSRMALFVTNRAACSSGSPRCVALCAMTRVWWSDIQRRAGTANRAFSQVRYMVKFKAAENDCRSKVQDFLESVNFF